MHPRAAWRRPRIHSNDGQIDEAEDALPRHLAAECACHATHAHVRGTSAELSTRLTSANRVGVLRPCRIAAHMVPEITIAVGMTPEQVRLYNHRMMKRSCALFERLEDGETCRL